MKTKSIILISIGVAIVSSLSLLTYNKLKEKKRNKKMQESLTPFIRTVEELESSSSIDGGCGCGA